MNPIEDPRLGATENPANGGTHSRIEEAALDLFFERGYRATTMRDIAKACGVTPGEQMRWTAGFQTTRALGEEAGAEAQRLWDHALDWMRGGDVRARHSYQRKRGRGRTGSQGDRGAA